MNSTDTIRLLELLSSKICHDLISPIGAVSNGVEILEEMGADDDVMQLIAFSATQANAKLKVLRMVYGAGGADESIKPEEVHGAFGDFIAGDNRVQQDWDPYADLGAANGPGFAKILMAALVFAMEGLPKGGVLSVSADDAPGTLCITGEGENAGFREGFVDAFEHKISLETLDNKFVHAYVTGLLAQQYGYEISVDETQNGFIVLRLKPSHVS